MSNAEDFLDEAIALAFANVVAGGRPFGAVVAKDGKVIARGVNRIQADNDPTAHAELLALRFAGQALNSPRLEGCTVYASGQPCPMCLAAMRLAGIKDIVFAYSDEQAEPYGLSTATVTAELSKLLAQQTWASIDHHANKEKYTDELYRFWKARSASKE